MGARWDRVLARVARSYAPKLLMMFLVIAGLAALYALDRVRHRFEDERSRPYELSPVVIDLAKLPNGKQENDSAQQREKEKAREKYIEQLEQADRPTYKKLLDAMNSFENDLDLRKNVYDAAAKKFPLSDLWSEFDQTAGIDDTNAVPARTSTGADSGRRAAPATTAGSHSSGVASVVLAAMVSGPTGSGTKSSNEPARPKPGTRGHGEATSDDLFMDIYRQSPEVDTLFATPDELFTELYERSPEVDSVTTRARQILKDLNTPIRKLEETILTWKPTADSTSPRERQASDDQQRALQAAISRYSQFQQIRMRRLNDLKHEAQMHEDHLRRQYMLAGVADLALARRRWSSHGIHGLMDSIVNRESPLYIVYAFGWYGALSVAAFALTTLLFGIFRAFSIGTSENAPPTSQKPAGNDVSGIEDILRKSIATVAALAISAVTIGTTVKNAWTSPINSIASADIVKLDAMVPLGSAVTVRDVKKNSGTVTSDPFDIPPHDDKTCVSCEVLKPYTDELNRSIVALNEHLALLPAQVQTGITTGMAESTKTITTQLHDSDQSLRGLRASVDGSKDASNKVEAQLTAFNGQLGAVTSQLTSSSLSLSSVDGKLGTTNSRLGEVATSLGETKAAADSIRATNVRVDEGILDQTAIGEKPPFLLKLVGRDEHKATELAARTLGRQTGDSSLKAAVDAMRKTLPLRRAGFLDLLTSNLEKVLQENAKDRNESLSQEDVHDQARLTVRQWQSLILQLTRYPH